MTQAARRGDLPRVRTILLRDPGAVNAVDRHRWPPLFHAALRRRVAVVRYLLEHGADPHARGGQALHFAGEVRGNKRVVALLLHHGALQRYARPRSPAQRRFLVAVYLARPAAVRAMLRRQPALARTTDGRGYSPLHRAAQHGDVAIMRLLIRKGGDIDAVGPHRENVLYAAAGHGHLNAVRLLIRQGVETGHKLADGSTVLQWVVRHAGGRDAYRPVIRVLRSYAAG